MYVVRVLHTTFPYCAEKNSRNAIMMDLVDVLVKRGLIGAYHKEYVPIWGILHSYAMYNRLTN